mmetsp:Transcript_61121/g.138081  ORF Transcript_61121/g.138081 Transcript_61121/m.138081 type:complete len:409 (-) Transcript_61121:66-1292(-)
MGAVSTSAARSLAANGPSHDYQLQIVATVAISGDELQPVYLKPMQTVAALKEELLAVGAAGDALGGALAVRLTKGPALLKDSDTLQSVGLVEDPNVQVVRSLHPPIVTASCDKTAKVWLVDTGDCVKTFKPHAHEVRCARFNPGGTVLATASNNSGCHKGQLKFWDVCSGRCLSSTWVHKDMLRSVAFAHDGRQLVTASDDSTAIIWDISTMKPLHTLTGHSREVWSAEFSPCGQFVVTGSADRTSKLWNVHSGQCTSTFNTQSQVRAATICKLTERVATAGADGSVKVWSIAEGSLERTLNGHTNEVWGVAFSEDTRWIVSAGVDTKVLVWEVEFGVVVRTLTGHFGPVVSVSFCQTDNVFVTASTDGTARVWNLEAGSCLQTLCGHHERPLWTAQFLPPLVELSPL